MIELLSKKGLVTYYTRVSDITHLYSETESDPVIMAKTDAPNLAVDSKGNTLPYFIEIIPIPVDKVETRVLVFADQESKDLYESSVK